MVRGVSYTVVDDARGMALRNHPGQMATLAGTVKADRGPKSTTVREVKHAT